ncbi:holin [Burkholderia cenocepacia]|nr:holin [Burkholderia cenocepacia]MBR8473261.1 holin [Burkholderia cenocepacia]MBR8491782.1 holin [Burkholderia cenocepacia]ODN64616.1 holin [Burkholderia cenocepacia]OXJ16342.1 holin [Burkholderia sp. HI2500]
MMVTIFVFANLIILAFCIWIAVTDAIATGWWGTVGFSIVGISAAVNVLKPIRMLPVIDLPETMMTVGTAIVCLWVMGRKAYWWTKGHNHGTH